MMEGMQQPTATREESGAIDLPEGRTIPDHGIPASVAATILVLAAIPMVLAGSGLGILHPDEVFQAMEPAYRLVHGYGFVAWEWDVGIRNWAGPYVFSGLLQLCQHFGLTDPFAYRAVLLLPQYLLQVGMLRAIYRLAADEAGPDGGLLTVVLLGSYSAVLLFAGHPLSESISVPFLVMGFESIRRDDLRARTAAWSGMLFGLAVVARYGSLVFVGVTFCWLVARRSWRTLACFCLGGLAVASGLGLLDWATWGMPFHSLIEYTKFNVFSGEAARRFGSEPWWYYQPLLLDVPLWAWIGIPIAFKRRSRSAAVLVACALVYLLVISKTDHKEARFLYPVQVFLTIEGAIGLSLMMPSVPRRFRRPLMILTVLISAMPYVYSDVSHKEELCRAIVRATRPADATGLLIFAKNRFGTGGYFYVGKNIPIATFTWTTDSETLTDTLADLRINRVVVPSLTEDRLLNRSFTRIDRVGRYSILARANSPP
jgi:phosphatidylinositol glycan class B